MLSSGQAFVVPFIGGGGDGFLFYFKNRKYRTADWRRTFLGLTCEGNLRRLFSSVLHWVITDRISLPL